MGWAELFSRGKLSLLEKQGKGLKTCNVKGLEAAGWRGKGCDSNVKG